MNLPKTIKTFGIWTQYTGFCFYEPHDILLKNGVTLNSMLPGEYFWQCLSHEMETWEKFTTYCDANKSVGIQHDDVVAVRLITDDDIEARELTWAKGQLRLDRIKQTYGDGVEYVIFRRDKLLKDHEVREVINELRNIAAKYGATQQLRSHVGKCFKDTFRHLFYNPK